MEHLEEYKRKWYTSFFPVERDFTVAIPGHVLRVIGVGIENDAPRVEYHITPPLPAPWRDERSVMRLHQFWPSRWDWYATDDLGNEYSSCGGACGLSRDGQYTDGALSLCPSPPPNASSLTVTINTWYHLGTKDNLCVFTVNLHT